MLSAISDYKNGPFYYIQNNSDVDLILLEALGVLISVAAKDVTV